MSQQAGPFATPWPSKVTHRFLTVVGATVDLRPYDADGSIGTCTGCDKEVWRGTTAYTKEEAQKHAERCRALPRPAQ
jgi:hypothetical protein